MNFSYPDDTCRGQLILRVICYIFMIRGKSFFFFCSCEVTIGVTSVLSVDFRRDCPGGQMCLTDALQLADVLESRYVR